MGKDHRGQPSGTNKSAEETGVPSQPGDMTRNNEMTEKHTVNDEKVQDNIREMDPNRNAGKDNAKDD